MTGKGWARQRSLAETLAGPFRRGSKPGRILLVTSNFGGGTGSHLVGMLKHVDPHRWQIEILCQGAKELEPPEHVTWLGSPASGRLERLPFAQLRGLNEVRRHLRVGSPDVVHTYFFWPIIYGRLLKRLGLIRHLVENREDQGFNLSPWNYRLLKATADVPDRVICVSEGVRQVVLEREGVKEERTVVIHNGVKLPAVIPGADEQRELRRALGFSSAHLIVGMVANLNRPVKGVGYFVDAMPLILAEVPDARFLILGEGREKRSLKSRARELGVENRVVFTGFRPDIDRFYPLMDVSALTSLSEGLSMTLLESMSFGLPVVATRVGGNPEIVRDAETGFLVPPRDPAAFAGRVVELLTNPGLRERMGRAGRRFVEGRFTLAETAAQYEEIYAEASKAS